MMYRRSFQLPTYCRQQFRIIHADPRLSCCLDDSHRWLLEALQGYCITPSISTAVMLPNMKTILLTARAGA